MAKAEAAGLADSLGLVLVKAIPRMDDDATLRLRSELSAVRAVLSGGKDKALLASAERALDTVGRLHAFASEVKGFTVSKEYSEKASLFDIASIGILATENVLTAERKSLFRLVMSGLSEGLAFAASRQYIYGSSAVLEALYRTHGAALYGALWDLAAEFRGPLDEKAAREVQAGLDEFFAKIGAAGVPVDRRVAVLYQLYAIIVIVRVGDLVHRMRKP